MYRERSYSHSISQRWRTATTVRGPQTKSSRRSLRAGVHWVRKIRRCACLHLDVFTPSNIYNVPQRYRDLAAEAAEKFKQEREQWFANSDPRILRALNAQRKAKNLPRIHSPARASKRPLTGYLTYVSLSL